MQESLDFHDVTFAYDLHESPLFSSLRVRFPLGWSGVVGANGAGKSTLLRLAVGELQPRSGRVIGPNRAVGCPQRTDDPPERLAEFLAASERQARELRGRLGVQDDWPARWNTLSHGERKRAQIAVALWQRPDVLALDEPTNHIDAPAREQLLDELRRFRGIGLLVSHDRDLLDELCRQCLFLDPPSAVFRPGGYTKGRQQAQADAQRARDLRDQAQREVRRLTDEATLRRQQAAREHKVRSKRGLHHKDHDAQARIDLARVTDSKAGAPLRQLQGRLEQARQRLADLRATKDNELSLWVSNAFSRMDRLLHLPAGRLILGGERDEEHGVQRDAGILPACREGVPPSPSAAPDGALSSEGLSHGAHNAGETPASRCAPRTLTFPALTLLPRDRIAVTGPNGAGKSTLLRHVLSHLALPADRVLYMPQELPAEDAADILAQVRRLPGDQLGRLMSTVARLGSPPQRLLQTDLPSPGEIRKVLLALGVIREAHLIVMDEPTNHLDLPSIQCMEDALHQCPCALLLVSHDKPFLRRLTTTPWTITAQPDANVLTIQPRWDE